ncbi:MAG: dUTP diphosphatase, partial [Candidatus Falkowbacteria bacterium]|nr:dUTP diphosphatase [Candidatus Falkowbacteria bacterium]
KEHHRNAGFDLYANDYYSIPPYQQALISTGIKIKIPVGFVGLIWDKSGLANFGFKVMGGVIDANYRDEVKIIFKNLSEDIYHIIPGQTIAKLLIQPIADPDLVEHEVEI